MGREYWTGRGAGISLKRQDPRKGCVLFTHLQTMVASFLEHETGRKETAVSSPSETLDSKHLDPGLLLPGSRRIVGTQKTSGYLQQSCIFGDGAAGGREADVWVGSKAWLSSFSGYS